MGKIDFLCLIRWIVFSLKRTKRLTGYYSIIYIEGLRDYIRIHIGNEKIVVQDNMKDICKNFPRISL